VARDERVMLPAHAQVVVVWGCSPTQLIQAVCADPFCEDCAKIRADRVRDRWLPVLLHHMHRPKLLTLTMKSQPELRKAIVEFQSSFRRFLDLRLGKRGLKKLVDAAMMFVNEPGELGGELDRDAVERAERWEASIDRFKQDVERKAKKVKTRKDEPGEVRKEQAVRLRDVIGFGFASYEVTYTGEKGWHFHRHCTVDGEFIPWPVLVAAWTIATKGAGSIVDIRAMDKSSKGMAEAIKYVTKFWEIPDEKRDEVRRAIYGVKRIWPLGGARPEKAHPLCPFCGQEGCRAHRVTGIVTTMDEGILEDGTAYRQVWDDRDQVSYLFTRQNGLWVLLDTRVTPLDLMGSAIACHSSGGTTTDPPQLRELNQALWEF
jgi:hypothetical protein